MNTTKHLTLTKRIYMKMVKICTYTIGQVFMLLPLKKDKIIFDNFAGKGYAGNPRYIADEFLSRNLNMDLVWLINDTTQSLPSGIRKVKYGSLQALYEYATSKVIIDNIRNSHLMKKKKGQVYLQTWHGSKPLKYIEKDAENKLSRKYLKAAIYDGKVTDGIIVDSEMQENVLKRTFDLNKDVEFLRYGLPTNDFLIKNKNNSKLNEKIKKDLNIERNIFTILYAPTFRDNGDTSCYITDYAELIGKFETKLKRKCIILVRMHPNVKANDININYNNKVRNVSDYPDTQELVLASDCVISDYSSIIFDFLLLEKIVFLYSVDLSEYENQRGLSEQYYDLPFPRGNTLEELYKYIETYNEKECLKKQKEYLNKCVDYNDGNSSKRTVDWILKKIINN